MSYLFIGDKSITRKDIKLSESVLIDFAGTFIKNQPEVQYYYDLSPDGDYLEAINKIYDVLRWAETKKEARCVLIINLLHF